MNDNPYPTYFLATTALEEFWDTSKPLLFLGGWCRRYTRKSFWEPLRGEVLASPWQDKEQLGQAYHYVADLYERLLVVLAEALGHHHQVSYSHRYWRIILGPWLLFYLPVIYDRYTCLRTALENYPQVTSTGLPEECWVTPGDTLEFVQLIKEDLYNLQLYSRILKILGYDLPGKPYYAGSTRITVKKKAARWKRGLKKFLVAGLARGTACRSGQPIYLRDSYFSWPVELKLMIKTGGRVRPLFNGLAPTPRLTTNLSVRSSLQDVLPAKNEFEEVLTQMIPLDVPQSLIEGFDGLRNETTSTFPPAPKAIFSAIAWYWDEAFKQWAAAAAENGTRLLGTQHGGNYGSLMYHPSEDHEVTITDRYYSWGWERPDHRGQVTPWPAGKLVGSKPLGADHQKPGILLVASVMPRYLLQFPHTPDQFAQYLVWQSRFVASLQGPLLSKIRVRLHAEDMGWDMAPRWRTSFPEIGIETWEIPFRQSLENCCIFVCDHLSTTFLEALFVDKPTILFWNPAITELRPTAQPYYDRLREVGILFDSPEAAADEVKAIFDNVVTWWNDPGRQAARGIFCQRFARKSSNALKEWADEFIRLSKEEIKIGQ